MPILGIDVGTQSLKALVLDDALRAIGAGSVPYQPSYPRPGWGEQDPKLWLDALGPAVTAALANAKLAPGDIKAMAVCGQLDGCVPTDAHGMPIGPALIWSDRRAEQELAAIDPAVIRDRCGLAIDPSHMGAKVAWLTRHGVAAATWHQPVSFVVEALTGQRVISPSLASTTMLYDMHKAGWGDELLALFGAAREALPEVRSETAIAGGLTHAGAALTGLPEGLPVAVGTGDDFSSLLGSGVGEPGVVAVSLGTAETVGALATWAIIDPATLVETHAFPGGTFHLGNPGWLCGGSVRWAAGLLGVGLDGAFSALAATAPAGCDGVIFIPALTGAMTPKWIAGARGSFSGLTASHGSAHLARAVLEGTAFAMRDIVDQLEALGVSTERVRLMGGGAQSEVWCQIRADLTGRPVEVLSEADASATGAGLIAAVAVGALPDIATATTALPLPLRRVEPNAGTREAYRDAYARYRETFAAMEPVWARS